MVGYRDLAKLAVAVEREVAAKRLVDLEHVPIAVELRRRPCAVICQRYPRAL